MNLARIAEMRAMAEAATPETAPALHEEIREEISEMQNILVVVQAKLPGPPAAPAVETPAEFGAGE